MSKQTTIVRIPIDKLFAHPENPNKMSKQTFEKLKRHISQSHNYEPVIVRRHPDVDDAFEIINGHHRVRALGELGESFADCVEWQLDDDSARVLLATLNRLGGKDELSAKIDLIKNLSEKFSSRELAKLLPDTKAVIEKLKSIESQIQNNESMAAWAKSPPYEFQMPCSLVFFLDDEQMRIVEQAIERCESEKGEKSVKGETRAEKMADAITVIAGKYLESEKGCGK